MPPTNKRSVLCTNEVLDEKNELRSIVLLKKRLRNKIKSRAQGPFHQRKEQTLAVDLPPQQEPDDYLLAGRIKTVQAINTYVWTEFNRAIYGLFCSRCKNERGVETCIGIKPRFDVDLPDQVSFKEALYLNDFIYPAYHQECKDFVPFDRTSFRIWFAKIFIRKAQMARRLQLDTLAAEGYPSWERQLMKAEDRGV